MSKFFYYILLAITLKTSIDMTLNFKAWFHSKLIPGIMMCCMLIYIGIG